jgi:hypothetical protein
LKTVVAGRRFLVVLLSAAALLAACGGTSTGKGDDGMECVTLCEKGKAAGCKEVQAVNCDDNCLQEDVRAETSGCRGAYNDSLSCSSEIDDICGVATGCRSELIAYAECIAEYCESHETDICSS